MSCTPESTVDNIIQHLAFRPTPCPPSPSWFIYERGFIRQQNVDGQAMCPTLTRAFEPRAIEESYGGHGNLTRSHTTSAGGQWVRSTSDAHMADAPMTPLVSQNEGSITVVSPTEALVASPNGSPYTPDSGSGHSSSFNVSPFTRCSPVLPRRASDGGYSPSRIVEGPRTSTLGSLPLPGWTERVGMTDNHEDSQEVESASIISQDGSLLHFLDSNPVYDDILHDLDIPHFVVTQCLEASVNYLTLQRRQWSSAFQADACSPQRSTFFPAHPAGYHDLPNDLGAIYDDDETRGRTSYRPAPEDSFANPPPEPPLPTDSLIDNIKAINHLMWLRMNRGVSGDEAEDEEVVRSILENIVLSRRVTDTHPDVVDFLLDVEAPYRLEEREELVEMLVDQISSGAQLCFSLGDRERACVLRDLADVVDAVGL